MRIGWARSIYIENIQYEHLTLRQQIVSKITNGMNGEIENNFVTLEIQLLVLLQPEAENPWIESVGLSQKANILAITLEVCILMWAYTSQHKDLHRKLLIVRWSRNSAVGIMFNKS